MKKALLISLILFSFSCQKENKKEQKLDFANEKDSYEIINLVFKDYFSKHRNYTDKRLSDTTTLTYQISPFFYINDSIPNIKTIKKETVIFEKIEKIKYGKLIDKTPCKDTIHHDACSENYLGIFAFSKVMINEKKDSAMINIDFDCGGKCGNETIYYLKKTNGKWNFKNKNITLIY